MKLLVVLCLVTAVAAAPTASIENSYPSEEMQLLDYENTLSGPGNSVKYLSNWIAPGDFVYVAYKNGYQPAIEEEHLPIGLLESMLG